MHGPVGAGDFGELAGAVDGIDDPHSFGIESGEIIGALFGQNGIVGTNLADLFHQELVRTTIAFILQRARIDTLGGQFRTDLDEKFTRCGREACRFKMVVMGHNSHGNFQPRIRAGREGTSTNQIRRSVC